MDHRPYLQKNKIVRAHLLASGGFFFKRIWCKAFNFQLELRFYFLDNLIYGTWNKINRLKMLTSD